jgi:predicted HTH transcriptional regulator
MTQHLPTRITRKGYRGIHHKKMFKISRQAAHKEIKTLMELGVIKSQGVGRATYYVLD